MAVEILHAAKPLAAQSEFVFPAPRDPARAVDRHSWNRAVDRGLRSDKNPDGPLVMRHWCPHDLRRTVRTNLARQASLWRSPTA